MTNRGEFNRGQKGYDLPIPGIEDLQDLGDAIGERVTQGLGWGVDLARGFFQTFETQLSGTFTDRAGFVHRVGRLAVVLKDSALSAALDAILTAIEDVQAVAEAIRSDVRIGNLDRRALSEAIRKVLRSEIAAYGLAAKDAIESLQNALESFKGDTGPMRIYLSKLYVIWQAYRSASATLEVTRADPEWSHYNGPVLLMTGTGAPIVAATYSQYLNTVDYQGITLQAFWTNDNVAESGQLDIMGRLDDLAAPGGLINVNTYFTTVGTGLGAAVQNGALIANSTRGVKFREIRVDYTKVGAAGGGNDTYSVYVDIWNQ